MSPAQYATNIPHPLAVFVSEPFNENENQRLNMEIAVLNERRDMANQNLVQLYELQIKNLEEEYLSVKNMNQFIRNENSSLKERSAK